MQQASLKKTSSAGLIEKCLEKLVDAGFQRASCQFCLPDNYSKPGEFMQGFCSMKK